jgi:hypothetical protein
MELQVRALQVKHTNMSDGWLEDMSYAVNVSTIGPAADSVDTRGAASFLALYGSAALNHVLEDEGGRDCIAGVLQERSELQEHADLQVCLTCSARTCNSFEFI